MRLTQLFTGTLLATILATGAASAAGIDQWEPVNTGTAIPSSAERSVTTGSAWVAYSNGSVFFTSNADAATPQWQRMDKGTNMGQPYDMAFVKPITALAVADTNDEYVAYVAMHSEKYYSSLYRCTYGRGNVTWTDLSAAASISDLEGLSVNPLAPSRVYAATSTGVSYSIDRGTTWQATAAGDPLALPTGTPISAVGAANKTRGDWIVAGGTNGELWLVIGARSGTASYTRLDQGYSANLPDRIVTRIQVDDTINPPAILAVFGGANNQSTWISKNGGQAFAPMQNPIVASGNARPTVLSASLSPNRGDATLYGQVLGSGAIRSDDSGQTWFQTPRWSGKNVAVEFKHLDRTDGNQLFPVFRVKNMGSVPATLKGLTFNYWFTPDGTATQSYACDSTPYGCSNVRGAVSGAMLTVTYSNVSATVPVNQSSGEVMGRVWKSDYSAYNQNNDYSFSRDAYDWQLNRHIRLTDAQGNWLWGSFAE
jgi:hypothetical protein